MTKAGLEARLGYPLGDETFASISQLPDAALKELESSMNDLIKMLIPVLDALRRSGYDFSFPHRSVWRFSKADRVLTLFLQTYELLVNFQHGETLEMLEFNINNYGRLQWHSWFEKVFDETI